MVGVFADSPRLTQMIFEAKRFKIFDFIGGQNGTLVITPQKYFCPPNRGGLGGSGETVISPPNTNFIEGLESVKILGVL